MTFKKTLKKSFFTKNCFNELLDIKKSKIEKNSIEYAPDHDGSNSKLHLSKNDLQSLDSCPPPTALSLLSQFHNCTIQMLKCHSKLKQYIDHQHNKHV